MLGNEQLPVPGVDMPNYWAGDHISWGIIEDTKIGYIYIQSWSWQAEHRISEQFYEAVFELMFNHDTTGMIIDMRFNTGGSMVEAHDGYSLLFDETIREVAFDIRGDPADHFDMDPHPTHTASVFTIHGDPTTYYDHPIAVLTGPGAVSNGDWESLRTRFHPMVRTFGRPSNGAFTSSESEEVPPYFWITTATGSGYLIEGHEYLAHTGVQPDEVVWLTPDDVAHGRDTVVMAAVAWINGQLPRLPDGRAGP
jgi:C-terminal processing protease CtpA/Prc